MHFYLKQSKVLTMKKDKDALNDTTKWFAELSYNYFLLQQSQPLDECVRLNRY